ncbi:hypothetical protein Ancab_001460, partial [Ancistrocladus abbreviatus]
MKSLEMPWRNLKCSGRKLDDDDVVVDGREDVAKFESDAIKSRVWRNRLPMQMITMTKGGGSPRTGLT